MRSVLIGAIALIVGVSGTLAVFRFPDREEIEMCRVFTKYSRMGPVDLSRPAIMAESSNDGRTWKALRVTLDSIPHLIRFRNTAGRTYTWTDNLVGR